MSHQTGIRANNELINMFAHCKTGRERLLKISIEQEKLVLSQIFYVQSSFDSDYKNMIVNCIQDNQPCFILFRLDTKSSLGFEWLFIAYSPDQAPVRQKMIYAATRATLKAEFGLGYIKEEMHIASKDDVSLEGLKKYRRNKAGPGPMTEVEQEIQNATSVKNFNDTSNQSLKGVAFPIDQEAADKLSQLRDGLINYVQLSVDTLNEAIKLERFDSISTNQLRHCVPRQKPRYHFYVFKHHYEGDVYQSVVFIYSMPSVGCTIKEKMLYSTCKGPFLDRVERFLGLRIDRKIEMDSGDEVNDQFLLDEIHPKINLYQPAFQRPKGPQHQRGLRRLTKGNGTN